MNGLNSKNINGLISIYSNQIIEDINKGDLQVQINNLDSSLTGGYNDRINKIETYVGPLPNSVLLQDNLTGIHNDISGINHDISNIKKKDDDQQIQIDTAISDIGVLDASVTAIEVDISTRINTTLLSHTTEIGTINGNLDVLNDKTQNISSLLTTTGITTFENSNIILNNGVSNQVELMKDSHSVFNNGINLKDDLILINGKSILSDNINIGNVNNDANIQIDGYCNVKKDITLLNNQKIIGGGTLTIDSGNVSGVLNLGTQFDTVNINGLLINLNGIVNGTGLTFAQF